MDRRQFLTGMSGILASRVAPWAVTSAGVLMPVKNIWTPVLNTLDDYEVGFATTADGLLYKYIRIGAVVSVSFPVREKVMSAAEFYKEFP